MGFIPPREQKRRRTEDLVGEPEDLPDAGVLVTDDDRDDDEDIEGDYYDSRASRMPRPRGPYRDIIDQVVMKMDEQQRGGQRTSLFTQFQEGEWSQMGDFVQLISVKIVEGAGKYLFGKILARNYRDEVISFYNRDSNNCELLDKKAVATIYSHQVHQIYGEIDIYFDLGTKDSEHSEEREVGRGTVSWQYLRVRPGIFSDLVRGEHGVARVTYAVIFDAVEAVIGVKIIGRSVKNLRAKVVAISEMFGKLVLFGGTLGDVPLEEESIPLWNSVFGCVEGRGQEARD